MPIFTNRLDVFQAAVAIEDTAAPSCGKEGSIVKRGGGADCEWAKRYSLCKRTETMTTVPVPADLLNTEAWQNAVFWLIMDSYGCSTSEPVEVVEETNEWIPQDLTKFREVLEEEFVLNPSEVAEDNFVAAKDIIAYVRSQNLNMSDTKIGREFGKLGLERTIKKVGGKAVGVWKGIKHS